jgi:hypothetical protein
LVCRNLVDDIEQVSHEESELLTRPFSMDEVRDTIFQMEHSKAPGPDGFPAEFYQACWEIIKNDLMALFREFHRGDLPLYSLNFGTIILLLKSRETATIQQYRPICLLNVNPSPARPIFRPVAQCFQLTPQPAEQGFVTPQRQMIPRPNLFQTPNTGNQSARRTSSD